MSLHLHAVEGLPEIVSGSDLAALIVAHVSPRLADDDIVVVTSKVVSKAAGLVVEGDRRDLIAGQTDRVVARRGRTQIVRTHHGLTLAAAGIDASNTRPDTAVLLPPDPDRSARDLRRDLATSAGVRVGVIVTDTAGRAWRHGQTDIAIGLAGVRPFVDLAGALDPFGNELAVTAPAVADELAGAAELVKHKLAQTPVAVVTGATRPWCTAEDGPGAAALIRPEDADLFGWGAADAVVAALVRSDSPVRGFPAADSGARDRLIAAANAGVDPTLVALVPHAGGLRVEVREVGAAAWLEAGRLVERLRALGVALGVPDRVDVVLTAGDAGPGR